MAVHLLARLLSATRALLGEQVEGWYGQARAGGRAAWVNRPRAARAAAMIAAAGLAAIGAGSLAAQRATEAALPSALDWRAAEALLARDGAAGDAVVLEPAWLERARQHVPADLTIIPAPAAGEPLPGVRRVWLVSAPGAPRRHRTAELELSRRAVRADVQRLGRLEVLRFDLPESAAPLAELAALAPASASLREAGGAARRCLVLPLTPGAALLHAFPRQRLGSALAGYATVLPGAGAPGVPVRLAFQVDGEERGALELSAAEGRRRFEVETGRLAPGLHELVVVVTASGAGAGPLCLEGLVLP